MLMQILFIVPPLVIDLEFWVFLKACKEFDVFIYHIPVDIPIKGASKIVTLQSSGYD